MNRKKPHRLLRRFLSSDVHVFLTRVCFTGAEFKLLGGAILLSGSPHATFLARKCRVACTGGAFMPRDATRRCHTHVRRPVPLMPSCHGVSTGTQHADNNACAVSSRQSRRKNEKPGAWPGLTQNNRPRVFILQAWQCFWSSAILYGLRCSCE